ncbi:MAG: hypothetical protein OXP75_00215 [Rhodospirillales bacterium]|nr:hypothetical protein [Rhodospirillales bacterium]
MHRPASAIHCPISTAILACLADRFDIHHVTVQIELMGCADEAVTVSG